MGNKSGPVIPEFPVLLICSWKYMNRISNERTTELKGSIPNNIEFLIKLKYLKSLLKKVLKVQKTSTLCSIEVKHCSVFNNNG